MKKLYALFAITSLFALSSCSSFLQVEKRRYEKGFYVHVNSKNSGAVKTDAAMQPAVATQNPSVPHPETVSVSTATVNTNNTVRGKNQAVVPSPAKKLQQKLASVVKLLPTSPAAKTTAAARPSAVPANHRAYFPAVRKPAPGTDDQLILVILAILLSPVAVYLKDGHATPRFWLDLICWLLGAGIGFGLIFYGDFLLLFAIIYALLIVLDAV